MSNENEIIPANDEVIVADNSIKLPMGVHPVRFLEVELTNSKRTGNNMLMIKAEIIQEKPLMIQGNEVSIKGLMLAPLYLVLTQKACANQYTGLFKLQRLLNVPPGVVIEGELSTIDKLKESFTGAEFNALIKTEDNSPTNEDPETGEKVAVLDENGQPLLKYRYVISEIRSVYNPK